MDVAAGAAEVSVPAAGSEVLAASAAGVDSAAAEEAEARPAAAVFPVAEAILAAAAQEDAGDMNEIPLDRNAIKAAIGRAEAQTSGEIRVVLYSQSLDDPVATARAEFARLQMHKTRERNAVLILVAPVAKAFAIYGDKGIHERCGDAFWKDVAETMTQAFRRGEFTAGIVTAVEKTGAALSRDFPRRPDDENELPDDVVDRGVVI